MVSTRSGREPLKHGRHYPSKYTKSDLPSPNSNKRVGNSNNQVRNSKIQTPDNQDIQQEVSKSHIRQISNSKDLQDQIRKIIGQTSIIKQNLKQDLKQDLSLIFNENTDHHIIHKKFFIQEEEFNIISLNIAQIAQERSMIIFGKYLADLLRSKRNLLKNKNFEENINEMYFEEKVAAIVKKYLPGDLSPTNSKITILKPGPSDNSQYRELFTDIENIYHQATDRDVKLQRIEFRCGETKKSPQKIRDLYKYDDVTTHVKYCDFYFEDGELYPEQYANRLVKALTSLRKRTETMQNVFICLQEINPYNTFVDTFVNFNNDNYFTLISPTSIKGITNLLLLCNNNYVEKNQSKTDALMANKRTLYQFNTINDITTIENEEDNMEEEDKKIKGNIIKVFRGIKKRPTQNLLYEIKTLNGATLHLYNIHGEWIKNETIMKIFQETIIPQIKENKGNNIITIIVGDFNFFLTHDYLHRLQLLLRADDIHFDFTYTPEVLYEELVQNNNCSESSSLDGFIYAAPSVQVNLSI